MVCTTNDVTLENFACRTKTYRDGDECKDCIAIGVGVGALNKNSKVKGKAQGLDEEAKGLGDKISSEEPEPSQKSPLAKGAPPHDEEQPVVITA